MALGALASHLATILGLQRSRFLDQTLLFILQASEDLAVPLLLFVGKINTSVCHSISLPFLCDQNETVSQIGPH
jgi:hypothetical protein